MLMLAGFARFCRRRHLLSAPCPSTGRRRPPAAIFFRFQFADIISLLMKMPAIIFATAIPIEPFATFTTIILRPLLTSSPFGHELRRADYPDARPPIIFAYFDN